MEENVSAVILNYSSSEYCKTGMRYHSNIFAYKMGKPFIPISYEHKMSGFMKMAGLEDNCIQVSEISVETIITYFERIMNDYDNEQKK